MLKLIKVEPRQTPEGQKYLRGLTEGRRHYSIDGGATWHRTLARAVRGDRRGRAGTTEGREARGGES